MSKKGLKLGIALAAGAGAAAMLAKNSQENKEIKATKAKKAEAARSDYRNTERGKYEKNSKGIYYTNGNYAEIGKASPLGEVFFAALDKQGQWD